MYGICGVWSICATLFGRWQQRCVLSLPLLVLQQLVSVYTTLNSRRERKRNSEIVFFHKSRMPALAALSHRMPNSLGAKAISDSSSHRTSTQRLCVSGELWFPSVLYNIIVTEDLGETVVEYKPSTEPQSPGTRRTSLDLYRTASGMRRSSNNWQQLDRLKTRCNCTQIFLTLFVLFFSIMSFSIYIMKVWHSGQLSNSSRLLVLAE